MSREDGLRALDADAGGLPSSAPDDRDPAAPDAPTVTCDLCGHTMLDLHCKLVCGRCGYKRDCSDP